MKLKYRSAPAHAFRACVGVLLSWICLAACERTPGIGTGDRTLELNGDTIQLEAGVALHDVEIRTTQSSEFSPAHIEAEQDDLVRFTSADRRTHALVINAPDAAGKAVLQASAQHRSPPLVARGQSWIISVKDVPPGNYVVSCFSHPGTLTLAVR